MPSRPAMHPSRWVAARACRAILAAALLLAGGEARAQVEWNAEWIVQRRTNHAMAYDEARDRMIVFGGEADGQVLSDTWEWDGTDWSLRSPPRSPPARADHALAYDAARHVTVLFGGRDQDNRLLSDTWEWDGTTWTERSGPAPGARSGHGMTYDSRRQVVVLGGSGPAGGGQQDLWEWDGTLWRFRTNLPISTAPTAIAYDSARQVTLLVIGSFATENWLWDGVSLKKHSSNSFFGPLAFPMVDMVARQKLLSYGGSGYAWEWDGQHWTIFLASPPQRIGLSLAYDSRRDCAIMMGGTWISSRGESLLFDTWEWSGGAWTQRLPSSAPNARAYFGLAYQPSRARVVLYGGRDVAARFLDETWELNGLQWQRRSPSIRPSARIDCPLANGPGDRIVMFGGWDESGAFLADTWQWDGTTWMQRNPTSSPPARSRQAWAYDTRRDRLVMFGGNNLTSSFGDTWEWDGSDWTQRFPSRSPLPRASHALAYDEKRDRVVLFGGTDGRVGYNDTWEWDGTTWEQKAPAHLPLARVLHGMAYDRERQVIVMFGGRGQPEGSIVATDLSDTWEWNGVDWVKRNVTHAAMGRYGQPLVYDSAQRETILFGAAGDTWRYGPVYPASYTRVGSGCTGTSGIPSLSAPPNEYPWLGTTLHVEVSNLPPAQPLTLTLGSSKTSWGPLTLPAQLGFLGMTGCAMYASGESVVPLASVGGTATWTLNVPNDPSIVTARFYNQAYVFDPGANPFGLTVSNAAEGIVGSK